MTKPTKTPRPAASLANLRPPWKKGERVPGAKNGNPEALVAARAKRSSIVAALELRLRDDDTRDSIVSTLLEVARDPSSPHWLRAIEIILERIDGPLVRDAKGSSGLPAIVLQVSPVAPRDGEPIRAQVVDVEHVTRETGGDIASG